MLEKYVSWSSVFRNNSPTSGNVKIHFTCGLTAIETEISTTPQIFTFTFLRIIYVKNFRKSKNHCSELNAFTVSNFKRCFQVSLVPFSVLNVWVECYLICLCDEINLFYDCKWELVVITTAATPTIRSGELSYGMIPYLTAWWFRVTLGRVC